MNSLRAMLVTVTCPTLTERKHAKVAAMRDAVEALARDLAAYARANGGAYTLFGSAARGELRHDSDVDILVDFPIDTETAARLHAEERAWALGLEPDLQIRSWSSCRLLERIAREGRPLL